MSKLTAIKVRNQNASGKTYKLPDGRGLYLRVSKSGHKSWLYRFRIDGKESTFTIGEYPTITLEQARKERTSARELVKAGINPAHERKNKKKATVEKEKASKQAATNSFERIATEWWEQQKTGWSKGHADATLLTLEADVFPTIGAFPVDTITPPMIHDIIREIESRGALEIARKVLQRTTAVFRYAVQTGRATTNPATEMKGILKNRKVTHYTALSIDDLPQFLKTLSASNIHVTTKLALQFTILTAARSAETRGARWEEIDLEQQLWTIPAERMKMNIKHTIPLSKQAIAILKRIGLLHGQNGLVFPGIRQDSTQLSQNTLLYSIYRLGYRGKATVHGFRATFSTIANESGFDADVIEKALAHEQGNQVRAAYHRSEYIVHRKELMKWWGTLLQQMEHGAEIIPLKAAAKRQ